MSMEECFFAMWTLGTGWYSTKKKFRFGRREVDLEGSI